MGADYLTESFRKFYAVHKVFRIHLAALHKSALTKEIKNDDQVGHPGYIEFSFLSNYLVEKQRA
jgi:hypothetical protein